MLEIATSQRSIHHASHLRALASIPEDHIWIGSLPPRSGHEDSVVSWINTNTRADTHAHLVSPLCTRFSDTIQGPGMPHTWDYPQENHPFSIWQVFSEQLIGTKCHDKSRKMEFGKAWSRCFKSSGRGPRKTLTIVWHLVPKRSGDE